MVVFFLGRPLAASRCMSGGTQSNCLAGPGPQSACCGYAGYLANQFTSESAS